MPFCPDRWNLYIAWARSLDGLRDYHLWMLLSHQASCQTCKNHLSRSMMEGSIYPVPDDLFAEATE